MVLFAHWGKNDTVLKEQLIWNLEDLLQNAKSASKSLQIRLWLDWKDMRWNNPNPSKALLLIRVHVNVYFHLQLMGEPSSKNLPVILLIPLNIFNLTWVTILVSLFSNYDADTGIPIIKPCRQASMKRYTWAWLFDVESDRMYSFYPFSSEATFHSP